MPFLIPEIVSAILSIRTESLWEEGDSPGRARDAGQAQWSLCSSAPYGSCWTEAFKSIRMHFLSHTIFLFLLYIFFLFLFALARPSIQYWITVVKVDITALFLIRGGKAFCVLSIHIINYGVKCRLLVDTLYHFEEVSFYSKLVESLYHEWMLDFIKCFSPTVF